MAELWLSAEAFLQASGIPRRTFQRRVERGEIKTRSTDVRGRNGRPVLEYASSFLTIDQQLQALATINDQVSVIPDPRSLGKQISLFVAPPTVPKEFRTSLTPEQDAEIQRRLSVLAPLLEFKKQKNGHRPVVYLSNGQAVRSMDKCAAWIAAQHGISRTTVWEWYSAYNKTGGSGLIRKSRDDKGRSRAFDRAGDELKRFTLAKFDEGLSYAHITDIIHREWWRLSREGGEPPSVKAVSNFLASVPRPLRAASRLNREQYDAKFAPHLITDIASVRVNQVWVADHRLYDVFVQNDCFAGRKSAEIVDVISGSGERKIVPFGAGLERVRIWETAIEDMRSRSIVGAVWSLTPSSRTISSALRLAIARFGMPEIFYCDNGKDFRKIGGQGARPPVLDEEGRVVLDPSSAALLHRLGIEVKYCIPRHPQSKQVESYFSTVSKRFDRIFGDAYTGSKPHLRSDDCRKAESQHKRFLNGERQSSPFPLASEFIVLARYWTEEFNATHAHGGRGMDNRSPYEVMDELLPANQRRKVDIVEIAELFWERQERKVANCAVQIDGNPYVGADTESAGAMYRANDSKVMVAFDPENLGQAVAYDLSDGTPIARLECQTLVARGPDSKQAIQNMIEYRQHLRKRAKQFWREVRTGVPTEVELLRERAGLPIQGLPQPLPPKVIENVPLRPAVGAMHVEDAVNAFLEGGE